MRGHLKKIGLVETEVCRFCEEEDETSIHILSECAAIRNARAMYLGAYEIEEGDLPNIRPSHILDFLNRIGLVSQL